MSPPGACCSPPTMKMMPPVIAIRAFFTLSSPPQLVHFMPIVATNMARKPSTRDTTIRARVACKAAAEQGEGRPHCGKCARLPPSGRQPGAPPAWGPSGGLGPSGWIPPLPAPRPSRPAPPSPGQGTRPGRKGFDETARGLGGKGRTGPAEGAEAVARDPRGPHGLARGPALTPLSWPPGLWLQLIGR